MISKVALHRLYYPCMKFHANLYYNSRQHTICSMPDTCKISHPAVPSIYQHVTSRSEHVSILTLEFSSTVPLLMWWYILKPFHANTNNIFPVRPLLLLENTRHLVTFPNLSSSLVLSKQLNNMATKRIYRPCNVAVDVVPCLDQTFRSTVVSPIYTVAFSCFCFCALAAKCC